MAEYENIAGSLLIIGVGMYLHLRRISIIDLKYSKLPCLEPNVASALFVFSTLCVLTRLRQYWWPTVLKKPRQFIVFMIELFTSLYATDLLVRQLWIPILRILDYTCNFIGRYVLVGNQEFIRNNSRPISRWINHEGYYYARFCLALCAFIFMTEVTGYLDMAKTEFGRLIRGENVRSSLSEMVFKNIYSPNDEEDEEEARVRARFRNNRQKKLRTARRRIELNSPLPTDYTC